MKEQLKMASQDQICHHLTLRQLPYPSSEHGRHLWSLQNLVSKLKTQIQIVQHMPFVTTFLFPSIKAMIFAQNQNQMGKLYCCPYLKLNLNIPNRMEVRLAKKNCQNC